MTEVSFPDATPLYLFIAYQTQNPICNKFLKYFKIIISGWECCFLQLSFSNGIIVTMNICYKYGIFMILTTFFSQSIAPGNQQLNTPGTQGVTVKRPTIMVWVHGTQPSSETLSGLRVVMQKIFSLFHKELPYAHTNAGLHEAQSLEKSHYIRGIIETLCNQNPTDYHLEHSYVFGWSGKLSYDARENASKELYVALSSLVSTYEKRYGQTPSVLLITHSHGGNVILNFGKIADSYPEKQLAIDTVILLACPVQKQTALYATSPLFKKIYSLYSKFDMIQVIDPQGLHTKKNTPLFSQRRFPNHPHVIQVELVSEVPIMHISFLFSRFIKQLPGIIQEADKQATTHVKITLKP